MDEDTEQAAWAQLENEQELLRADPAFDSWLDQLELKHEQELTYE